MWPSDTSNSAGIFARAKQVLPGGISRLLTWVDPYPIYAKRGVGAYIEDVDGVRRLDLMNNFASLIHGHAYPPVVEAVGAAIANGSCFAFPTELEIQLAELICERIEASEKVRFCNSGTEAVMIALKAARARTGRHRIAKIEGAYHGMYDHAEVSLDSTPENWGNAPASTPHVHGTPPAVLEDTLVLPLNQPEEAARLVRANAGTLAAILIDPVPTQIGMVEMTPEFIDAIQAVAREIGALIIIDEVIAFRLDYHGAQARFGIKPDLSTFAKIIGGGYPVGAITGTDDAMSVFSHEDGAPLNPSSGTFTGNPVSMAAGLATMTAMTPEIYQRLEIMGERARAGLRQAFETTGRPGQVTGVGAMFQIHFHDRPMTDYRSAFTAPAEAALAKRVHRGMLDRGYIFSPRCSGFLSSVMTDAEIDGLAQAFADTLRDIR
ncbi:MAG: aspartate aminotransferase family protein [Alphaproteobacteria bacterium]|jgi:glutamate-1-semialdehyde 2,1-aminomutase|nr:aspartate aminotransferase family protein [Alphaproteobacteria bacterium]